jgi:hypothetical protein
VEVLGEFELQRSMAWKWDAGYSAWTSQVSLQLMRCCNAMTAWCM